MKYLTTLLLFFTGFSGFAQQNYQVNIEAKGKIKYKYAYFYTWTDSSMQKQTLIDNRTVFKGNFKPVTDDDSYQAALIIISNEDIVEKDLLKNK